MKFNPTLRDIANLVVITIGIGWLLFIGSGILLPLIFAAIFAIFLYPIDKKIHSFIKVHWISVILSFLCVLLPISLIGFIFGIQLVEIIDSLPSISNNLKLGLEKAINYVQGLIPNFKVNPTSFIKENLGSSLKTPLNILSTSLVSTSSLLISIFLSFIYTFFILLYKKSIKAFIVYQFEKRFRPDIRETLNKIKLIVQSYIGGLFMIIGTLSVVNSLGLWLIGINYPIFWGTLAGFLAIIPYIGTGMGGLLPFLYSLATYDYAWQPVAVILFYAAVQTIEGNLLTPKIVGDKVNINPLFAVFSLMFFGSLWGVSGIILALPLVSILRIIMSQFEPTNSLAILMSSGVEEKSEEIINVITE